MSEEIKFTQSQANFVINFGLEMLFKGMNLTLQEIQSLKDNLLANVELNKQKFSHEIANRINPMIISEEQTKENQSE